MARDRSNKKQQEYGFQLDKIQPRTDNQAKAFNSFFRGKNILLHGLPGTGKTFLAMYLALTEIHKNRYQQVTLIRSAVPTRDMGFMPGNMREKAAVYEAPYQGVATELYNRGDAYQVLKQKNMVSFATTSFVRGITLNDCVIIVDEAQNMSYHELSSIITRMGDHAKLIICGDVRQDDLTNPRFKELSGLREIMSILKKMGTIDCIEFGVEDIVRSDFVKDFIVAKDEYERKRKQITEGLTQYSNVTRFEGVHTHAS